MRLQDYKLVPSGTIATNAWEKMNEAFWLSEK